MKADDIRNISEAYNLIYEAVTDRPAGSSNVAPYGLTVNPESKKIRDRLFAQNPSATPSQSKPTTPAVKPPVAAPETPVSPGTTSSPTTSTPAASTTTPSADIKKTFQQELDDLRKASAKATMVGPSKEAQALMSQRTKNILGAEKLTAGIKAQQEVEKMKSEIGTPKPAQTPTPTLPPTTARQPQPPLPPKSTTGLTKDQLDKYNQATGALKNPFTNTIAKGRVKSEFGKMTPDQQKVFREYLKTRPKGEQDLYKFIDESVDIYDEILEILLDEGYSEKESNEIMVHLVSEGFWDVVKQRTGIGKPGVGPGQVAKNILRAGISDVLGTSIATGSTPSSVSAASPTPSSAPSPAPQVRVSTQTVRTAPKGANIVPDPWKQPSAPRSSIRQSRPSTPTTTTRSLPGTNVRGLLSAGKPPSQNVTKPVTSVRSQQFQDVQRLNRMTGGGLMGELPSSKPAPKPSFTIKEKLPPKPTSTVKPSIKPNIPGGSVTSGAGILSRISRYLPHLAAASAGLQAYNSGDGTLGAAMKRGDYKLPATPRRLRDPEFRGYGPAVGDMNAGRTSSKPAPTLTSKPKVTKPSQSADPDVQQYEKLKKTDPVKAKELGMKIWSRKYRSALTPPEVA